MIAAPRRLKFILPMMAIGIAVCIAIWFHQLPEKFTDQHNWPIVAVIAGTVLFLWGIGNLFWLAIPTPKVPQAILFSGTALMVLSWLLLHSLLGVIAGGIAVLIGVALLLTPKFLK